MSPNKKVLLTVLTFVVAMAVIACSCSSLIPNLTTTPTSSPEAMTGLAGTWQDPDTNDQFVIVWQNNAYVVTSVTWERTSYTNNLNAVWSYSDGTGGPETLTRVTP
ncbi:MAG: hypothetical protein ABSG01_16995 [Anaerolineales bacterium]